MSTRTLSAILLAASALVACGDSKPAPQAANAPVRLRLQLNWVPEPEFGGFYAAQFDGLFRDAGLPQNTCKVDPAGRASVRYCGRARSTTT